MMENDIRLNKNHKKKDEDMMYPKIIYIPRVSIIKYDDPEDNTVTKNRKRLYNNVRMAKKKERTHEEDDEMEDPPERLREEIIKAIDKQRYPLSHR